VTDTNEDLLALQFETHREHLVAVAVRMVGSKHEAEDAVQETWLRFSRADIDDIDNLGGWLTTVVARICLDMLRSRVRSQEAQADAVGDPAPPVSPEEEVLLADSVGLALLVVLDTLSPAERLTFVLHDLFAVSFAEIAPIVGRTPAATRQLGSRARRRVQSDPAVPDAPAAAQREVVAAFLAAARQGEFSRLLALLDPDVVLRADAVAIDMAAGRASAGAPALTSEVRGVDDVAQLFAGGARAAKLSLIDGLAGAVVTFRGRPMVAFAFTLREGRVAAIELLADPETLDALDLEALATE
jgi:RNA polymerase sigma factor (sigma-70 family)